MAKDAAERLTSLTRSPSSLPLSWLFFPKFHRKSELLSYLILCVSKMPFIPPASLARSVSGLSEKEKPANGTPPALPPAKAKVPKEDKGSSVTERLALNLKQLRKKSPARSQLPTARGVRGGELYAKRKEHSLPSSRTRSDGLPASSSGESLSKAPPRKPASQSSARSDPEAKSRSRRQEEEEEEEAVAPVAARFTLTLTPEAVLLLQRRNSERQQQRLAGASGNASDARRRKENPARRLPAPAQRRGPSEAQLRDVSSFVKISLLNEQHRYDDVEYEEQEQHGVDERVVLKCTEWLRGLESTPVTARSSLGRSATAAAVKTF